MIKTFRHRTTSNCSWDNKKVDREFLVELVEAIAKFEEVNWSQILINKETIELRAVGVFCDDGKLFELDITVDYRVAK